MTQILVDELKRRGEEILKASARHLAVEPKKIEKEKLDLAHIQTLLAQLKSEKEKLQIRADELYQIVDSYELEAKDIEDLMDSISDMENAVGDLLEPV